MRLAFNVCRFSLACKWKLLVLRVCFPYLNNCCYLNFDSKEFTAKDANERGSISVILPKQFPLTYESLVIFVNCLKIQRKVKRQIRYSRLCQTPSAVRILNHICIYYKNVALKNIKSRQYHYIISHAYSSSCVIPKVYLGSNFHK